MASTIVIPEDAFNDATLKMCQARTVAELLSHMDPAVRPAAPLRRASLEIIMALNHQAYDLLAKHGKLVP